MSASRNETGKEDHSFVSRRICENTWKCWTLRGREALAGGDRSARRFGVSRMISRTAFFYVQDERYIAGEHKDVRRDCVSLAQHNNCAARLCQLCTTLAKNARRDRFNFVRQLTNIRIEKFEESSSNPNKPITRKLWF